MTQLQREHNVEMQNLNSNVGFLTGVLQDISTHLCRAFPAPLSPFCGPTPTGPTPSASATEMEALQPETPPAATSVPAIVNPPTTRRHTCSSGSPGEVGRNPPPARNHKPNFIQCRTTIHSVGYFWHILDIGLQIILAQKLWFHSPRLSFYYFVCFIPIFDKFPFVQ